MYEFKANDGNVYGPVDEGKILEWVNSGQMNSASLVRKTPDGEWLPLSQIQELSHISSPQAATPAACDVAPVDIALYAAVAATDSGSPMEKPPRIKYIGIQTLVGGILAVLVAIGWGIMMPIVGLATFGLGCILIVLPIYALTFGIMAIIKACKMLGENPVPAFKSAKHIAIMQICMILCCDGLTAGMGIANLIMLNHQEVKDYLRSQERKT
ncbi:MAG: DUF4339 domain-containing protein [Verrucomicrobiota bacterium]|jgi:hypothetical protein|nr:DUF4339 domain-containing protein [Verrucomicrobiota bacterium]